MGRLRKTPVSEVVEEVDSSVARATETAETTNTKKKDSLVSVKVTVPQGITIGNTTYFGTVRVSEPVAEMLREIEGKYWEAERLRMIDRGRIINLGRLE